MADSTNNTLTDASVKLFTQLAWDAGNWNGTPLLDITKEERGNLTQLKAARLLKTFADEGNTWVRFTEAGIAKAAALGYTIE